MLCAGAAVCLIATKAAVKTLDGLRIDTIATDIKVNKPFSLGSRNGFSTVRFHGERESCVRLPRNRSLASFRILQTEVYRPVNLVVCSRLQISDHYTINKRQLLRFMCKISWLPNFCNFFDFLRR